VRSSITIASLLALAACKADPNAARPPTEPAASSIPVASSAPPSAPAPSASARPPLDLRAEASARGATWLVEPGAHAYDDLAIAGDFLVWNDGAAIVRARKAGGPAIETKADAQGLVADATHAFWLESFGGCPKYEAPDSPRCRPFGYRFMKVGLAGGAASTLVANIPKLPESMALDERALYWFDATDDYDVMRLRRVDKRGGAPATVADKVRYGYAIQFDGDDILWATYERSTNGFPGGIVSVPRAGGKPNAIVSGLEKPGTFVVDRGALFWWHARAVLQTAPKTGGAPTTLASDGDNKMGSISFEVDATDVWFVEHATNETRIRRVPRAGGAPTTVVTEPIGISLERVDDRYVYFVTHEPKDGEQRLKRLTKSGGTIDEMLRAPGPKSVAEVLRVFGDGGAIYVAGAGGGLLRMAR